MQFTKVVAVAMVAVGLMAPAVAAPVPVSGGVISRQQDNGANGPYCEPLGACVGIPAAAAVKRQQDFVNVDPELYGDTVGIPVKREQKFVEIDPVVYAKILNLPIKRQQDNGASGHYCEPHGTCGGIPAAVKREEDSTNLADISMKRNDGDSNPDDCDPKSECGGPMGMRPGVPSLA